VTQITLFSVPKAFEGHVGTIQRNAVRSWLRLQPDVEIVLFGNERGVAETAAEFGVRHVPLVDLNEFGTPLVNFVFQKISRLSSRPLLCYVNADIILFRDFIEAADKILFDKFLMVGRRWDQNVTSELDFSKAGADAELSAGAMALGSLHAPAGSDYFVFPRNIDWSLPDFAVGRPGWDNWLLYRARVTKTPIVDVSKVVTVIHQNHDYSHVSFAINKTWEGPEADRNLALIGRWECVFTLWDATHLLTKGGIKKARNVKHLWRRFASLPALSPKTLPVFKLIWKARPICRRFVSVLSALRRRLVKP